MNRSTRTICHAILAGVMFLACETKLQAAVITLDAVVTSSTFGLTLGETGVGSITYDESLVDPGGGISPDIDTSFSLSLTIFGQTFSAANDIDFDVFPLLTFDLNSLPSFLDYIVDEASPFNPTSIIDPRVLAFTAGTLTETSPGVFRMEVGVDEFAAAVPEPNSIALLGVGAVGLICCIRRKRKRSV